METKKAILKWYEDLGKITKDINDYKDFWEKINEKSLMVSEKVKGEGEKQEHEIVVMKDNWQHPIKLFFYDLECYKIIGF